MSDITEYKEVRNLVTVGYACDICDKRVDGYRPKDWFHFSHQHNEWGNDSFESEEDFDVCSVACYRRQLEKSIEKMAQYSSSRISGMPIDFAKNLLAALKS